MCIRDRREADRKRLAETTRQAGHLRTKTDTKTDREADRERLADRQRQRGRQFTSG